MDVAAQSPADMDSGQIEIARGTQREESQQQGNVEHSNHDHVTSAKGVAAGDPEMARKESDAVDESGHKKGERSTSAAEGGSHGIAPDHPTTYLETIMNLFKGNIGSGLFAMGDAIKHAGIVLGPILTILLGIVCVHSQHLLIKCADKMRKRNNIEKCPDFAETVEMCFECGPQKLQRYSKLMKLMVNIFICVTQLGFCTIYFVFISSNLQQVFNNFGFVVDVHIIMIMIFIPIMLPSLIKRLKHLAYISTFANFCMIIGLALTLYYITQDLPSIKDRAYVAPISEWPLYFGTAIYSFEGISLVLPLKNSMKKGENFSRRLGVLNVGMTVVTGLLTATGFLGYLRYGENVEGSLTLNIPEDEALSICVKIMISLSVLLGYSLQFFVAIEILWPSVQRRMHIKNKVIGEMVFRTLMIFLTFLIAEAIPKLGLFISLIGALCSTALALVFPPLIELAVAYSDNGKGPTAIVFVKNIGILFVALVGFATGTYESIHAIIREF